MSRRGRRYTYTYLVAPASDGDSDAIATLGNLTFPKKVSCFEDELEQAITSKVFGQTCKWNALNDTRPHVGNIIYMRRSGAGYMNQFLKGTFRIVILESIEDESTDESSFVEED